MVRILVCGGRHFGRVPSDCLHADINARIIRATEEQTHLHAYLRTLHETAGIQELLHLNVRGAPRNSAHWARIAGISVTILNSPDVRQRRRGTVSNLAILKAAKVDLVLQFPAPCGDGEQEMIESARSLGTEIRLVSMDHAFCLFA
jgi:hypothetical protein